MKNGFLLIRAKFPQKILLIKKVDVTSSIKINRNKYSFFYSSSGKPDRLLSYNKISRAIPLLTDEGGI